MITNTTAFITIGQPHVGVLLLSLPHSHARARAPTRFRSSARLRGSELCRLEGGMASSRSFFISLSAVYLLLFTCCGATTSGNKRANQERCAFKVKQRSSPFETRFVSATFN